MIEKEKALEIAIDQIEKQFGKGSVMRLGESGTKLAVDTISTGSLSLDLALGIGGIPRGRITEIFGPESSGKSTLAYHIVAQAQAKGGNAAYIDVEHTFDPTYASHCGVKIADILVSQPDAAEQALEITEALVRSGAIDVIVVDTVAALVPRAEIEGDMGDAQVGLQARLMSQALRKQTAENCERLRGYQRALEGGFRIARVNTAGEKEFLGDAQRASELERTRAQIEQNCR